MYTVSRTFDTAEEAAEFLTGGAPAPTGKKKVKKAPVDDAEEEEEDDTDILGDGGEDDDELTLKMLQAKVQKIVAADKKSEVVAILKKMKAGAVSELPETKYKAFMDAISKIKLK